MEWEAVIGLEVHAQLATQTKIFSGAATAYGAAPNTQACAVDLGLPGVLPVLNAECVRMAIKFGLSTQSTIAPRSIFARKNYFYPDLPKGYQISQYEHPIVYNGHLDVLLEDDTMKRVGITRAHLEEDAGKSLHESFYNMTGLDFNRAGTALLEIVSEPDLRSAKEAVAYLKALHALVTCLNICDGNMQEGSFRCDANVSVRRKGESRFGTRTETKNVNSFRFVERAINYEIERQIQILESGGSVRQETRLFDSVKNETRPMRSKEEANDYRYFPDPDLLPVMIQPEQIEQVRATMPELPWEKQQRFQQSYGLSRYDANVLTSSQALSDYYETTLQHAGGDAKLVANWVMGDVSAFLNKNGLSIEECPVTALQLAILLQRILDNTISGKIAKTLFEAMWAGEGDVDTLIEKKGLKQVTDDQAILAIIQQVIQESPQQLADYQAGKDRLFGYFVGQVMQKTQGKANPQQVNDLLKTALSK